MNENETCFVNITRAGRRRRLVTGIVVLAATTVGFVFFVARASAAWTLLAVPAFAFGMLCVIQALENT